jgi:CubicO group peptidase (beta-lactamase class C family)
MRIRQFTAALAMGVAALALSACAESINTTVSRYQAMPAPQGQTFFVVADGGMAHNGGLEFQRYAGLVAQQLQSRGFTPAANAQSASMVVQLGYAVDRGQVRYVETPGFGPSGFGYGGYFGRRSLFHPRFGWGIGYGYGWGWDDPFWYGDNVDSYVEYHSQIDLHIRAAGSNAALFDGRAQARSETNRLDVVIPSLVDAMFTGFPGRNGEVVKITIPTRQPPHG